MTVDQTITNQDCSVCGLSCPKREECEQVGGSYQCESAVACDAGVCGAGKQCVDWLGCVTAVCTAETEGDACAAPAGSISFEGYPLPLGTCCSSQCILTESSPDHCGLCSISCSLQGFCDDSSCEEPASCSCSEGQTCYGTGCFFTACGAPGTAGESCVDRATGTVGVCCADTCVFAGGGSAAGAPFGAIIPTTNADCGGCGISCPGDQTCYLDVSQGDFVSCGPSCASACPPGSACVANVGCVPSSCDGGYEGQSCVQDGGVGLCCSGQCVDPFTTDAHCGLCPTDCTPTGVCSKGACVATPPCGPDDYQTSCNLDGGLGACCNGACAPVGSTCVAEACPTAANVADIPCATGDGGLGTCCQTRCVASFSDDPLACGGCGVTCGVSEICSGSHCGVASCNDGGLDGVRCFQGDGGSCCAGVCRSDYSSDPQNCGACDSPCPGDQFCSAGSCGFPACLSDGGCPGALLCCNGACTDPRADGDNCGTCGNVCGYFAQGSSTGAGDFAYLCCGGTCMPDNTCANCGGCGMACGEGEDCGQPALEFYDPSWQCEQVQSGRCGSSSGSGSEPASSSGGANNFGSGSGFGIASSTEGMDIDGQGTAGESE